MKKYLSLIALFIFPFTFLSAESPKTKILFGEVLEEKFAFSPFFYLDETMSPTLGLYYNFRF